jgi:membrane-bound ClpP family serine protease
MTVIGSAKIGAKAKPSWLVFAGATPAPGPAMGAGLAVEVGASGTVVTAMQPVGEVDFSGRRYECSSDGGYLDRGTNVCVVNIEGHRIVVRPKEAT